MATACDNDNDTGRCERLSDIAREPQCWLLPIEGYERKPLVSLEEAVEPLSRILSDIKRKAYVAKQSFKQLNDGLTPNESAAIKLYTMGWLPHEQCLYFSLNKCLRDKERENLKPWFLFLKLFLTALEKLPSSTCVAFRGVKMNLADKYPPGSTFIWWGFSSCTMNVNTLQMEKFLGKTGDRTLFVIECYSGKNICQHSYYEHENEILLPPARQLLVVGCLDLGNGLHLVQLKETEPSIVLIEPVSVEKKIFLPADSSQVKFPLQIVKQNPKLDSKINKYQRSTRVNLTYEELTDQDMPTIVNEVIISKASTELDLSNNQITSEGVSILALALHKNTTLKALSLLSNQVSDQGIFSLVKVLSVHNSSLTTLGLGSNEITDDGIQYLAEMLRTNQTLLVLTLQNNQIGNRGVVLLMDTLARFNKRLAVLNISSNTLINDSCVDSIINMFTSNQTLREFYMIKCSLSSTSIKKIQHATKSKRNLDVHV
jgi:Ran GTPase-activating protein (RanGAP) involved in mRNA processing and transport